MSSTEVAGVGSRPITGSTGERVPSSAALRGRLAHRRRAPRRRRGGRRGARSTPPSRAARAAFPAWAALGPEGRAADPASASPTASWRARRSSPRSRRPTTARCSLGNVHRVVPRAALNIEFFAELRADARATTHRLARGHEPRALRPRGRRRADHAVERAADADHLEGRPGARGRQHGGREAAGVGAAHLLAARRHRARRGRSRRRPERRAGHRRGGRRGARRARATSTGSASPARPDTARLIGQAAARTLTPVELGARRQVAVHRLRRRRPRRRGADGRHPVPERRAGVPRRYARPGRGGGRRRVPREGARSRGGDGRRRSARAWRRASAR